MSALLFGAGLLLGTWAAVHAESPVAIVVGDDPNQFPVGWTDGICYAPISGVRPGDELEFNFQAHNVYKMASRKHLDDCDFSDAILLADVGASPFAYTVTDQDAADGAVYFSCDVGSHCKGGQQKLQVDVTNSVELGRRDPPTSTFLLGASDTSCGLFQSGAGAVDGASLADNRLQSECTDPVLGDDGRYQVSCLSGPVTLTPGGVINSARLLHYPYPTDRRVVVGLRTWEFVSGDPIPGKGGEGVSPVPINQLYVHHLSGRVILGQGTEGIRRSEPDAPFPEPYGALTGDEGDLMVFHIIDLRNVTDWLPCAECRCKNDDGTYLDTGYGDGETGGVDCCTNCTSLVGPTVDYRMRYNVSYSDIPEEEPITEVLMLTADISPAVGKNIEFDVPSFKFLDPSQQLATDPYIQRLERVGPFNTLFKMEFFGDDYSGPDEVHILRCVGHLHIAAVGMWLEDATTGETLCAGVGTHGTDPDADKGFLTAISVENYDVPKVIPSDRPVRLVTEYNATILHTGVMGMWFMFISGERNVTRAEAALTVDVCVADACDTSLLPAAPGADEVSSGATCEDALAESPACKFGNLCDCEAFVNAPESTGCGGTFSSNMGDIPVDSMCAKYCDACPQTCVDALPESPACKFGNLCDCDVLVNSPESTGCGGTYSSNMGDIIVNDLCASYCDACPDAASEEVIQEKIVEQLESDLVSRCEYATEECRLVLSNLYSCADGQLSTKDLDPNVESVIMKHGRRLALKHSKLGDSSLHRNEEEEAVVMPCEESTENEFEKEPETEIEPETESGKKSEAESGKKSEIESGPSTAGTESNNNTVPLIAGIVGGVAFIAAVMGGVWYARGRKSRMEKNNTSSIGKTRRESVDSWSDQQADHV